MPYYLMKFIYSSFLILFATICFAQNGYEIKVTLKPYKNQYIYLGHYYGKQLPIVDSVKLNEKSEAVFKGNKKLGGGIYLIGFPDRSTNFEILIDKTQHFSIVADAGDLSKITFINSPENKTFKEYQEFMIKHGKEMDALLTKRKTTASQQDSLNLSQQIDALNIKIKNYRKNIMEGSPNSLLAALLYAMREPEVPQNHPAAKTDSLFAYHYFKNHYWDGVNFFDDRLTRTPFFEPRLDKYFEQMLYPSADSVIKEINWMMSYAGASEEMEKFLLLKFVNRYLNQKYMWEDAVFVHLFEKYFSQKDYSWLTEKGKKMITDRAYNLMANILGNPAPEINLPDTTGQSSNLYNIQSPYVLVAIWDPTCGHCKETLPKVDSFYRAKWKDLGMKIYSLAKETDGTKNDWLSFIHNHELGDWVNVYYSKEEEKKRIAANIPGYSQLYDVQTFPTLYLLDKDKRIIAKKVTYQQVDEILSQRVKNKKNK